MWYTLYMLYTKINLSEIPVEKTRGGIGSRQTLIKPEYLTTPFLESITKIVIHPLQMLDWHLHTDIDEVMIITAGEGKFYYKENRIEKCIDYKAEDVIIVPSNILHRIIAEGPVRTEAFFFRIKAKPGVKHTLSCTKRSIADIPLESIHGAQNTQKILGTTEMVSSDYLEAITKGILRPKDAWEPHDHKDTDEIGIVLKGQGIWIIGDEKIPYQHGDVLIVQGNTLHTQEATGDLPTEFFFIRVKAK